MVLTSVQLTGLGESLVEEWLTANGFTNVVRTVYLPGRTEIQADGKERRLVRVKAAQLPSEPGHPTVEELRSARSRAEKLGRVAYVARVSLDAAGNLGRDIDWVRP